MFSYPDKVQLAQIPTPLQSLDRMSEVLGGPRIWLKRDDLTGSHLSGNKVRKLEFILARAQSLGADTLITCGGTQSNHCRATAFVAAQLGMKCHLILRQDDPESAPATDGNLLLGALAGASIEIFPAKGFASQLSSRMKAAQRLYSDAGHNPYLIPIGASDGVGIWGYIGAAEELKSDFQRLNISPKHIVCASGSGGTQAGLTVGAKIFQLGADVLGFAVCDNADYFFAKVRSDIAAWRREYPDQAGDIVCKVQTNDQYIGAGYAQASDEVLAFIAWVAKTEGVLLDPVYTGKAFYGLVEEIKKGTFSGERDIVFVHTGGAFGVFPWRQRFASLPIT